MQGGRASEEPCPFLEEGVPGSGRRRVRGSVWAVSEIMTSLFCCQSLNLYSRAIGWPLPYLRLFLATTSWVMKFLHSWAIR